MQKAGVEVMEEKLRELLIPCTISTLKAKAQYRCWNWSGTYQGTRQAYNAAW
ncbi:hypothetical protein HX41_003188 [Salmonella enterica subsp. enterica]|nr:hypothetical protein [Salmonella enterica subsp. enterica]EKT7566171.1 hypothetical protein [Salmonella enterica]EKT7775078.1 hypothetical protein [Salmonella enterica]